MKHLGRRPARETRNCDEPAVGISVATRWSSGSKLASPLLGFYRTPLLRCVSVGSLILTAVFIARLS